MPLEPICDYVFALDPSDELNAYANGEAVVVTQGMLRFAQRDEDLALVLGHELAHNTQRHMDKQRQNQAAGALVGGLLGALAGINLADTGARVGAGAYSQEFESEADYIGAYYAARAGYEVRGSADLWRRMAVRNPQSIHLAGTTHPSTAVRFLAMEQTTTEIAAKQRDGRPLLPEFKPAP